MRLQTLLGVLVLGAVVLTGCTESRSFKNYSDEYNSWSYSKKTLVPFKDWFLDGTDIFSPEIGAGEIAGIDIQPTELFQFGFLFGDVMKVGYRQRGIGFYQEAHKEGGLSYMYYRDVRYEPIVGNATLFDRPRIFSNFPIRYNSEWHWGDLGVEIGVIFFDASLHASPKEALDFMVSTLMLPVNVLVRPPLASAGLDFPNVDFSGDDTAAQIAKKNQLQMPPNPEMFQPTEFINDLVKLPY